MMLMLQDINWFDELFLKTDFWGYLGPFALVFIGYILATKNRFLAVLWFIIDLLFISNYLSLVSTEPAYWWHILIILLGGIFGCLFPASSKR